MRMRTSVWHRIWIYCLVLSLVLPVGLGSVERAGAEISPFSVSLLPNNEWDQVDDYNSDTGEYIVEVEAGVEQVYIKFDIGSELFYCSDGSIADYFYSFEGNDLVRGDNNCDDKNVAIFTVPLSGAGNYVDVTYENTFKVRIVQPSGPIVTASIVDDSRTATSANVSAEFTNPTEIEIVGRGFVYSSMNKEPSLDNESHNSVVDSEEFIASLTELEPYERYYVSAYVTGVTGDDGDDEETYYSETQSFWTLPQLTAYSFTSPAATGTINHTEGTVAITVPFNTNVSALAASFEIAGDKLYKLDGEGEIEQETGVTSNDFSEPIEFRVYGNNEDDYADYTITVTTPTLAVTASVVDESRTATSANVSAEITNASEIEIEERGFVYSTNTDLLHIGNELGTLYVDEGDFIASLSGLEPYIQYYVVAFVEDEDNNISYSEPQSFWTLPQLTAYSFTSPAATGTINHTDGTVAIRVPYGTNVTSLVSSFTTINEAELWIGEYEQSSGESANDFTSPITLKIFGHGEDLVTYTVTVTVASPPSSPTPTTETFTVDVEDSGLTRTGIVMKTKVERTTLPDGTKQDDVTFPADIAKQTVDSIIAAGSKSASIVIPDPKDEVSELNVTVPKESNKLITDAKMDMGISTDNVKVIIPNSSLEGFEDDLFFKFIPIKKEEEKQEVKNRAQNEAIVKIVAGDKELSIVGRPMTIETNLQSRPVTLVMPLGDVDLSEDELKDLGIYIEHSDGTKELLRGVLVPFNDKGDLGLQFTVGKFSTFTLVHIDGLAPAPQTGEHTSYMRGYKDGTFKPENSVTRAEMAAILSRVVDRQQTAAYEAYSDVASKHWANAAIAKVTRMGLMKGYSDGTFGPEKSVTRAEMAVLISTLIGNVTQSGTGFADIKGHWAYAEIIKAQASGMISGYSDDTFKPNSPLTRAETVTIMNKVLFRGPLLGLTKVPWSDVSSSYWAILDIAEASLDHTYEMQADGVEQWTKN